MATPGINTKVKMDGEKEYRAALAQINAGLKNLGAEMRATEQDFADNADSVEALTAKGDVLARQMQTQQEKVDTLREVLQHAGEAYGEADKRTIDWKTSLIDAETKLKQMQASLEENNDELDKAGASGSKFQQAMDKVKDSVAKAKEEGTGAKGVFANLKEAFSGGKGEAVGLGDAIGGAADKLGINLPEGATKALNSLNGISAGSAAVIAGFAAITAAIVKVEKELIGITKESAEYAKEVDRLSSVTGQNAQDVQAYSYAAERLGITYDQINDALKETTNKMQEAHDSAEASETVFDKLGVSVRTADGKLRNATAVLVDTKAALGAVDNATERAAMEMEIFGGSLDDIETDKAVDKITSSMVKAQESAESTVSTFDQLGVSITDTDGNLRDANDVFRDTIDALSNVENKTERDALAMDLLSENARELNPLIEAGYHELDLYAQSAKDTGKVLTEEELTALEAVDNQFKQLEETQKSVKNHLAAEFAPYLEDFYKNVTGFIKNVGDAMQRSGLVDAFGMLLDTFGDLIPASNELSSDAVPKLTQALRPLAELMAAIADTADFFAGLFTLDFKKAGKALGLNYSYGHGNNIQTLREHWDQRDTNAASEAAGSGRYYAEGQWWNDIGDYKEYQKQKEWEDYTETIDGVGYTYDAWKNLKGYNAAGTDNFIGGVTWVGENGPEPVWLPQGSRIGTNQEGRSLSGGDTYNFIVQANEIREIDDFIRRMKNQRRVARMGVT